MVWPSIALASLSLGTTCTILTLRASKAHLFCRPRLLMPRSEPGCLPTKPRLTFLCPNDSALLDLLLSLAVHCMGCLSACLNTLSLCLCYNACGHVLRLFCYWECRWPRELSNKQKTGTAVLQHRCAAILLFRNCLHLCCVCVGSRDPLAPVEHKCWVH